MSELTSTPPPDSDITVEDDGQLLKINVPNTIIPKGGCSFEFIWFGMTTFVTIVIISQRAWYALLFIAIFWAVGFYVRSYNKRLDAQKAILAVKDHILFIVGFNVRGKIETELSGNNIADIIVGDSGVSINEHHLWELQIFPFEGEKIKLFTGRKPEELHWLANKLKSALQIKLPLKERVFTIYENTTGFPPPPYKSNFIITVMEDEIAIKIPPPGIWAASKWELLGSLFWFLIVGDLTSVFLARNAVFGLVLMSIFWLIGFFILGIALFRGFRNADFSVKDNMFHLRYQNIFKTIIKDWRIEDITDVSIAPTGIKINGNRHLKLQISAKDGNTLNLLSSMKETRLYWLVFVLRKALNLIPAPKKSEVDNSAK